LFGEKERKNNSKQTSGNSNDCNVFLYNAHSRPKSWKYPHYPKHKFFGYSQNDLIMISITIYQEEIDLIREYFKTVVGENIQQQYDAIQFLITCKLPSHLPDYGKEFCLTGVPPAKLKLYKQAISVYIKENEDNRKFYDTVQGDGYCGMLALLQSAFNREKIHLEKLKDREWVIQKIHELRDNNEIDNDRVQEQFLGMIEHLCSLPIKDLLHSEFPFLPSSTDLWIGTHLVGTNLMKKLFNFNLWAIDSHVKNIPQRFYQYDGSNDTDFDLSYRNWKQKRFNNNHKNIFYRDNHFFQGPGYTSEFLSNKFDEAVDNLIHNIVAFIRTSTS
jgi:hypothetical protein